MALFDTVVVSAEVGMIKPNLDIFEITAQKMSVKPSECVFTDDSEVYCEAARSSGMRGIHYQDFGQFKSELEQILSHA